jgi:hypothetical protein
MNFREIEWEGEYWMHLVQDRPVAGSCEHANESSVPIKGGEFLD